MNICPTFCNSLFDLWGYTGLRKFRLRACVTSEVQCLISVSSLQSAPAQQKRRDTEAEASPSFCVMSPTPVSSALPGSPFESLSLSSCSLTSCPPKGFSQSFGNGVFVADKGCKYSNVLYVLQGHGAINCRLLFDFWRLHLEENLGHLQGLASVTL